MGLGRMPLVLGLWTLFLVFDFQLQCPILTDWWIATLDAVAEGAPNIVKVTINIAVLRKGKDPTFSGFIIKEAWPRRLRYSDLDAQISGVFVESLVIAHEGIYPSGM